MAVTVHWFNKFIEHVGKGDINLTGHTFKVILVNGYTFDATDDVVADIGSVELSNGNGYTTGGFTLTSLTFAFDTEDSITVWDADNAEWTATGGAIGPADGAICIDTDATGDMLCFYIDFGTDETAGEDTDFKITFNANGILAFAEAA